MVERSFRRPVGLRRPVAVRVSAGGSSGPKVGPSVGRSLRRPMRPSVGGPTGRSAGRSVGRWTRQSVGKSFRQSVGRPVSVDRLFRRPSAVRASAGGSAGRSVGPTAGRSVGRSVRWRGGRPPIFVKPEIKLNSHLSDSDRCEILSYFERRPCRSYNTTLGAAGFAKNLLCAWGAAPPFNCSWREFGLVWRERR